MTRDEYVQELSRLTGIDVAHIECVDCSEISNELDEDWLDECGECEAALRASAAERVKL